MLLFTSLHCCLFPIKAEPPRKKKQLRIIRENPNNWRLMLKKAECLSIFETYFNEVVPLRSFNIEKKVQTGEIVQFML